MAVEEETNVSIVLTGAIHRLEGTRSPTELFAKSPNLMMEDIDRIGSMVVVKVTPFGALLDEEDRLALARWLLVDSGFHVAEDPPG